MYHEKKNLNFYSSIFEMEDNILKFIKKLVLRIPLFFKIFLINFNNLYKKRKNNKQHIQYYINNKQSEMKTIKLYHTCNRNNCNYVIIM